ncbi:hypothetical protein Pmani_022482 [Petrolisthes manimaculis]|uniref:Uncharacterized protein n=1 Tax=Petrolisthes manimaculis TaxID=1843537 RepID=A0AAE1PDW3_9EUCA|nr:hypothetical protein Pmani_022482 [Petrolisthes manimaculis]
MRTAGKLAPTVAVPQPMDQATISTKRHMEPDSDSSSDSPSPMAKSSKSNETSVCNTPEHHLPQLYYACTCHSCLCSPY